MAERGEFSERLTLLPFLKRDTSKSVLSASHMRVTHFSRPNAADSMGLIACGEADWRSRSGGNDLRRVVESSAAADQAAGLPATKHQMARKSREKCRRPRGSSCNLCRGDVGCNAQRVRLPENLPSGVRINFFCLFWPWGKFSGYLSETVAPLHPTPLKPFIYKVLCGVQRGVQQGATGCNEGETEGLLNPLHPHVSNGYITCFPCRVQWCTGSSLPNFSRRVF